MQRLQFTSLQENLSTEDLNDVTTDTTVNNITPNIKAAFPVTLSDKMTKSFCAGRRALSELKKGKATYLGSGLALSSLAKVASGDGAKNDDVPQQQDHGDSEDNTAVERPEDNTAPVSPQQPTTPTRHRTAESDDEANETGRQTAGTSTTTSMTRERALWLMRTHPGKTYADRRYHAQMLCHLTHVEACEWRRRGYDDAVNVWLSRGKKRAREAQGEEGKTAAEVSVDDSEDGLRSKRSRRKDAQECANAIRHQMRAAAAAPTSPASPCSALPPDTEGLSQLATMNHQFRTAVIDNLTFTEVAELYVRSRGKCPEALQQPQQFA